MGWEVTWKLGVAGEEVKRLVLGIYPTETCIYVHQKIPQECYSHTLCHGPKLETIQYAINKRINKSIIACFYNDEKKVCCYLEQRGLISQMGI